MESEDVVENLAQGTGALLVPAWWNSNNWAWLRHPRLTTSDSQPITDSGNLSLGLLPQTPQICVGAGLHGLGMSACFIASLTLMTESGGKSLGADQVVFFLLNGITHTPTQQTGCHDHLLVDHC